MTTYKLFRIKNGKLYPLYVLANKEMLMGRKLKAEVGELKDATHVKAKGCGGVLRLRGGWHSTTIPFTDWIGKKAEDGTLIQRKDTVWCQCEVPGKQIECNLRNGYEMVPENCWYYFKTNSKQQWPWIISDRIIIKKILSNQEVATICQSYNITPQKVEGI